MQWEVEDHDVGQLLAATQDPALWSRALRRLASRFSADHAFAYLVSPDEVQSYTSCGSEEILSKVVAGSWHERNPRMLRGLEFARSGRFDLLTDWRLFSPDEIAGDEFEQDFAVHHSIVHYAGTFIPFTSDAFLVVSIERGAERGVYGGSELDNMTSLFEHSRNSIGFALRAQAHLAANLVDSLDTETTARAWLDGNGRIQHRSPGFDSMVGRFVGVRNGRLVPLDGDGETLDWIVSETSRGRQTDVALTLKNPNDEGDQAVLRAIPLRTVASRANFRADVLVSIEVKNRPVQNRSQLLTQRYRLTPAEVRLALRLEEGLVLRAAAEAEGISYQTARTRLRIIFSKLSVTRQSELIRVVGGL